MAKHSKVEHVAELVRSLVLEEGGQQSDESACTRFILRMDEGTLFLNQANSRAYSACLDRLVEVFGKRNDLSPSAMEQALQRTIFSAIDIPKKRQQQPLEKRIQAATAELLRELQQPAKTYRCYIPVAGVESKGLPYRFGTVTLLNFSKHQLQKFKKAVQLHNVSDDEKRIRIDLLKKLQHSMIWNSPCALTNVKAQDPDAALVLARQQVRIAMDIINFFSDFVPHNLGWLHFPEEAVRASLVSPTLREDGLLFFPRESVGPVMKFSFEDLRKTRQLTPFIRKLNCALSRNPGREIDDLVISAVQWAGRASVEVRREEAFLLSAIALESVILPEGDPKELSYRLRIRVAHLLGDSLEDRAEVSKEVSDLYAIRSKIVHRGHGHVTDAERNRMKAILSQVILKILSSRTVANLGSREQLGQWFERKVLS